MKRTIYILLAMALGGLLSFIVHALLEIIIINLLTANFEKYNLGFSWSDWFLIHTFGTWILLAAGIVAGYFMGRHWWKIIYIEKRYRGFMRKKGFTLTEILLVISVISILASVVVVATGSVRAKARDTKRKAELSQIGQFLSASSCYMPNAGAGDYDVADLFDEIKTKYPQVTQYISSAPKDPKAGTEAQSFYRYIVNDSGRCTLYANLENADEAVTLTSFSAPAAGGGTGTLQSSEVGWNGTNKYFQISN